MSTTLEQILEAADDLFPARDFSEEWIIRTANEGLLYVARVVNLPGLSQRVTIPFAAGSQSADLPADYMRDPTRAVVGDREIKVFPAPGVMAYSLGGKFAKNMGVVGELNYVAPDLSNGKLYGHMVPREDTDVTLTYYRTPSTVSAGPDVVEAIPDEFATRVLAHYIGFRGYDLLEDSVDGGKPHTQHHRREFLTLVAEMRHVVGGLAPQKRTPTVRKRSGV